MYNTLGYYGVSWYTGLSKQSFQLCCLQQFLVYFWYCFFWIVTTSLSRHATFMKSPISCVLHCNFGFTLTALCTTHPEAPHREPALGHIACLLQLKLYSRFHGLSFWTQFEGLLSNVTNQSQLWIQEYEAPVHTWADWEAKISFVLIHTLFQSAHRNVPQLSWCMLYPSQSLPEKPSETGTKGTG